MMRRTFAIALVAAGLLGCTSDDSSSEPTSASSSTTGATTSTETTTTVTERQTVGDPAVVPSEGGGEATGPLGSTRLRVETDEGTVQIGGGSVPERFSQGFPLPADLDVQLASETATDLGFSGESALPFDELVELFENELPAAGFTVESVEVAGVDLAVIEFSNADGRGDVVVTQSTASNAHTVIVTFADGTGDSDQSEN